MVDQRIALQSAVRSALRAFARGRVSHDEALKYIDECFSKFAAGEPIVQDALPSFPLWFRAWQWSHAEPVTQPETW